MNLIHFMIKCPLHMHLPIIFVIVIIITRFEIAFDARPVIIFSQFLKPFSYFWMDTDEKESTFIHGGFLSSVLKSIVTLQKLLTIEKHLTTAIGIGTPTRSTASFDWHAIIGSLQDF